MRSHASFPALGFPGYVSVLPYIAHGVLAVEPEACKVEAYALGFVRGVEDGHGVRTVGERFDVDLLRRQVHNAFGSLAQSVLVDGDNLLVEQNAAVIVGHLAQVVGHGKHRRQHTPHAHLRLIFGRGTTYATEVARRAARSVQADHQHIHVGPLSRTGVFCQRRRYVDDVQNTHAALFHDVLPHIAHIA